MQERTPNQIRDEAIKCFNQLAPDIINDLRGEAIDFWFYVETAARQMEEKDERIEYLEGRVAYWEERSKR